ncbi:hypothetical protein L211DRAFT_835918 [Terfezia boudieri ATCC MYA-4762]|uniref:Uncharacterized protein n=1 Tax=Terfezia boudieri ATCC MYA-4762 TaxID=1051890 RepID=A0A3N4LYU4_9PEZI|nr:hypothetical protein L211DRAFT_835918 [Terfezia boudieri ATCC MYA-4762]
MPNMLQIPPPQMLLLWIPLLWLHDLPTVERIPLLRKYRAGKNNSLTLRKKRFFLLTNKDGAINELQTKLDD